MSDDYKVVCLLHEVVNECETNSDVIFAGMTLMSAVIKTIKADGDAGYQDAEYAKMMIIKAIKEL
jgi:hypothetical protein